MTASQPSGEITIVTVPCYNESQRIDLRRFGDFLSRTPAVEFLFVDDGSTDATRDMLADFCANHAHASYRFHTTNRGKAEAVRTGMRAALEHHPAFAGYWDADLSTPPEAILAFQEVMHKRHDIDLVIGARVQLLGRAIARNPVRHYLGRVFATAVSIVMSLPAYDTQCGAKLFRATPLVDALFREQFKSRWIFDVEVLARMARLSGKAGAAIPVFEYPLDQWTDNGGSKLRPLDFVRAAFDLVRIAKR